MRHVIPTWYEHRVAGRPTESLSINLIIYFGISIASIIFSLFVIRSTSSYFCNADSRNYCNDQLRLRIKLAIDKNEKKENDISGS
jgi:hypothetical protein